MGKTTKRKAAPTRPFDKDLEERRALMGQLRRARDDQRKLLALEASLRTLLKRSDARLDELGALLVDRARFAPTNQGAAVRARRGRKPEN